MNDSTAGAARAASAAASIRAELDQWLSAREPAAPADLRARINKFIDIAFKDASMNAPIFGIATALGESAIHAMRAAVARCEERAAAVDLLAADALLTYMMEAAAEQGSDAIDAVADAYGNARLAQLVSNTGTA